jgi:hypothetical protein
MHGSYIPVVSLVILYWQVLGAQELDVAYIYTSIFSDYESCKKNNIFIILTITI